LDNTFEEENSTRRPNELETYENLVDLKEIILNYNATKVNKTIARKIVVELKNILIFHHFRLRERILIGG
jgi:hypothetical protein